VGFPSPVWPRLLLAALALTACAASPSPPWPDQVDITVSAGQARPDPEAGHPVYAAPGSAATSAGPAGGVMLCLVDVRGQARCHHRDGVLQARTTGTGEAACPGAGQRLGGVCPGRADCTLRAVPAPAGTLGILMLDLHPPVFGVPRHAVAEAAVLSAPAADQVRSEEDRRAATAVRALARCLAPSDRQLAHAPIPLLSRQACEDRACPLTGSSLRLARPGPATTAGLWQP
jgi:hypothetical protein